MIFKAKLRRIGNSLGVLIPKQVITKHKEGDEIMLDVITPPVIEEGKPLPERKPYIWCKKHKSSTITCGCK